MEKTLQVLNDLVADGVLGRYAIGGAMGATFYAEPVLTFDLDIFVILPQTVAGLSTLVPAGTQRFTGGGVTEAREVHYEQTPTRVLRAEHLVAIALQTGRDKNRERVRLLREQANLDGDYLANLMSRHGLEGKWKPWTP